MQFDRSSTAEYIMLDWVGRGRFTHYPSGDTCLRHEWMVNADGNRQWDEKLTLFFARHPEAKVIVSGRWNVMDNADNMPHNGGGLEVGDTVVVRNNEGTSWSHQIVSMEDRPDIAAYRGDQTTVFKLDDGAEVAWDCYATGWFAYGGDHAKDKMRVRKTFENEITPSYDEVHATHLAL